MLEVKKQYFELLVLLNKSNKLKNQKTELRFYLDIENKKLMATVDSYFSICLCEKAGYETGWIPAGFTKFEQLEKKICAILDEYNDSPAIEALTPYILARLF